MKKTVCILFCAVTFVLSCSDDTPVNRDTFDYFQKNLKADMKYAQLTCLFGKPDNDIGSGIHIYVYKLEDGTKIIVGYTDFIHSARHVGEDDQLLHVII